MLPALCHHGRSGYQQHEPEMGRKWLEREATKDRKLP
jgi:hypothetical protein